MTAEPDHDPSVERHAVNGENPPTANQPDTSVQRRCVDFLYWHAVTKMRMGEFSDAGAVFRLLFEKLPQRTDAGLGQAYCLARLGRTDDAAALISDLRRRPLAGAEGRLLGRLQRRCEFELSKARRAQRELQRGRSRPVGMAGASDAAGMTAAPGA